MMRTVRITSDGTSEGTHVFAGESEIKGITNVKIITEVGKSVVANIELVPDFVDVVCDGEFKPYEQKREFLDKEIRYTTKDTHPDKLSLEEFTSMVEESIEVFSTNMKRLGLEKDFRYIEKWAETFLAWLEIEQKNENE